MKTYITIDASITSSLDWQSSIKIAHEAQNQAHSIIWDFDCGLFEKLVEPLDDEAQFLTLELACQLFKEKIYPYFSNQVGIILFRGDLSQNCRFFTDNDFDLWLEEKQWQSLKNDLFIKKLFYRDQYLHFIKLLSAGLPDELNIYIEHTTHFANAAENAYFFSQAAFEHIQLINHPIEIAHPKMGIAVPEMPQLLDQLNQVMDYFKNNEIAFKTIPEQLLTQEWDGLDTLVVFSSSISAQTKRKLMGFCAAGGTLICYSDLNFR